MKPDDPSVLIAAQKNLGVFRTADGGVTWTRVDQSMDQATVSSVVAWAVSDPNVVYCQRNYPDNQHVVTYVSSDAGVTWRLAGNLRTNVSRYDMAMAVDPRDASRVILADTTPFVSQDGLRSYHPVKGQFPLGYLPDHLRIVFAPSDPTIAYSANDEGLWRSNDRGGTWFRFDAGVNTNLSFGFDIDTVSGASFLPSGDYNWPFNVSATSGSISHVGNEWSKFYIDPNDSATAWYIGGSDLSVTHDGGKTWRAANPDPNADSGTYRRVLRFHPTQKGTLFFLTNKVWVSHDGGVTWADVGVRGCCNGTGYIPDMIFDLAQPGTAYVSETGGIWTSADGGATWTENKSSTYGLPYYCQITAPTPGMAGTFYMSQSGDGIYLVTGGGRKAQLLSGNLFRNLGINDLATDTAHPERVYVGTNMGLFFSQDYGQSWQRLGRNLPASLVWQILIKGGSVYAATSQGIWQFSSDVSWQPPPPVNFAVTAKSASSITMSWTRGNNSTGVRIFRNGVQTYIGLENNYTDLDLTPATNYCYTALDSNASGEGPLSSPICVNTLSVNDGLPLMSIGKRHTGNFIQGQAGATYTVTVSNAASAGMTAGTVTVTETVPSGMNLVLMAGSGWTCPAGGTTCTRSDSLNGGLSYPAITVTVNVASSAATPLSNSVAVSGGGSASSSTSDSTVIGANSPVMSSSIAVFRASGGMGVWYLDNGNNVYDAGDKFRSFGLAGDQAVAGDWTGNGQTRLGVFRNGVWYLDLNNNGQWDGVAGGDGIFAFGLPGDIAVVGDWNGDGRTKLGIFRCPTSGGGGCTWVLDMAGVFAYDPAPPRGFSYGLPGDRPVVNNWNGMSNVDQIGVYRAMPNGLGLWIVDSNGSGGWDASDAMYWYGLAQDIPVVGNWNSSARKRIGVFRNGVWILDTNGNNAYDATDAVGSFGLPGDQPVVGNWSVQ